jgi:hypothetical protein
MQLTTKIQAIVTSGQYTVHKEWNAHKHKQENPTVELKHFIQMMPVIKYIFHVELKKSDKQWCKPVIDAKA